MIQLKILFNMKNYFIAILLFLFCFKSKAQSIFEFAYKNVNANTQNEFIYPSDYVDDGNYSKTNYASLYIEKLDSSNIEKFNDLVENLPRFKNLNEILITIDIYQNDSAILDNLFKQLPVNIHTIHVFINYANALVVIPASIARLKNVKYIEFHSPIFVQVNYDLSFLPKLEILTLHMGPIMVPKNKHYNIIDSKVYNYSFFKNPKSNLKWIYLSYSQNKTLDTSYVDVMRFDSAVISNINFCHLKKLEFVGLNIDGKFNQLTQREVLNNNLNSTLRLLECNNIEKLGELNASLFFGDKIENKKNTILKQLLLYTSSDSLLIRDSEFSNLKELSIEEYNNGKLYLFNLKLKNLIKLSILYPNVKMLPKEGLINLNNLQAPKLQELKINTEVIFYSLLDSINSKKIERVELVVTDSSVLPLIITKLSKFLNINEITFDYPSKSNDRNSNINSFIPEGVYQLKRLKKIKVCKLGDYNRQEMFSDIEKKYFENWKQLNPNISVELLEPLKK